MLKVEIKKVRFFGKRKDVTTIDTFYFSGEDADQRATKFSQEFNSRMPFYTVEEHGIEGYDIAWKPSGCYVFPLTDILTKAFDELRNSILALHLKDLRVERQRNEAFYLGDNL